MKTIAIAMSLLMAVSLVSAMNTDFSSSNGLGDESVQQSGNPTPTPTPKPTPEISNGQGSGGSKNTTVRNRYECFATVWNQIRADLIIGNYGFVIDTIFMPENQVCQNDMTQVLRIYLNH